MDHRLIGSEEKRKSIWNEIKTKVTTKTTGVVAFLHRNDSRMLRTWSTFQLDAIIALAAIAGLVGMGCNRFGELSFIHMQWRLRCSPACFTFHFRFVELPWIVELGVQCVLPLSDLKSLATPDGLYWLDDNLQWLLYFVVAFRSLLYFVKEHSGWVTESPPTGKQFLRDSRSRRTRSAHQTV